ncbi:hypothetical protein NLM33_18775 [Bradyrhizobium sp. CCGUVB1N3]|uniref:hypothetical protein n=1 Tax=Bradyrhizobium sp. CCGUVB1N3 TaxID=2949629 RepID=UPI0020B3FB37|nr:hypothetical protein [Bradyrhizobium sp. CCGUVB1N3]MCP3471423.1 hypothetical protein [Bradyrhizobium sp. CCGUVB1N3]MCP3472363.1 hypothetical protein [Bradyrhizobium sp. CCGUVB1N3]
MQTKSGNTIETGPPVPNIAQRCSVLSADFVPSRGSKKLKERAIGALRKRLKAKLGFVSKTAAAAHA